MSHSTATAAAAAPIIPDLAALLPTLPPNVTRAEGAELLRQKIGFPVSKRTLERWALVGMNLNGKLVVSTAALFELAVMKMHAAPVIAGGRMKAAA